MLFQDDLLTELIKSLPRTKVSNIRFKDTILISLSIRRNQLYGVFFPAHPPWIEMILIHMNDSSFIEHDTSIVANEEFEVRRFGGTDVPHIFSKDMDGESPSQSMR